MAEIEMGGVTRRRGPFVGVRDLDLPVADREFRQLPDPSGCGKSTTTPMIGGLGEATSGDIPIGGRKVNRLAPRDRDIAWCPGAIPDPLQENIRFPLEIRRISAPRIPNIR